MLELLKSIDQEANQPKRVLFLTASSGGGHNGLLSGILEELSGDQNIRKAVFDLYQLRFMRPLRWLARIREYCSPLWSLLLAKSDSPAISQRLFALYRRPLQYALAKKARTLLPDGVDYIVAVHHISAHCLSALAQRFSKTPRTILYISDYEPHWFWIAKADYYVVASEAAKLKLLAFGVEEKQILQRDYLHCRGADTPRVRTGRTKNAPFRIAITSGADATSFKNVRPILRALEQSLSLRQLNPEIELLVVCGNNHRLRKKLAYYPTKHFSLQALGFVHDLPALLRTLDLVILRAGPQTLTEAAFAGTPALIFSWHAHERANCRLFEQRLHAKRISCPESLAIAVTQMAHGENLDFMRMRNALPARSRARQVPLSQMTSPGAKRTS